MSKLHMLFLTHFLKPSVVQKEGNASHVQKRGETLVERVLKVPQIPDASHVPREV